VKKKSSGKKLKTNRTIMKNIMELYHQLNEQKSFEQRYPNYNPKDEKIHILFVAPFLNASGYYRMIAPALEINRTNTHVAILSSINKWDFNNRFDDYDTPVDVRLLKWAYYVVLPAMTTNANYIIESFSQQNNKLQFVMDLDSNLHALPKEHP